MTWKPVKKSKILAVRLYGSEEMVSLKRRIDAVIARLERDVTLAQYGREALESHTARLEKEHGSRGV